MYPQDRLRNVSPERLRRCCLRGEGESDGRVRIRPALCERVRFGQVNLCQPLDGLGPFDVIFLRDVLIYFDAPTKRDVVDRVLARLRPGGLFFIGTAEGRVPCATGIAAARSGRLAQAGFRPGRRRPRLYNPLRPDASEQLSRSRLRVSSPACALA